MKQTRFLFAGALLCGFGALANLPVFAQPLPLERATPATNNLPVGLPVKLPVKLPVEGATPKINNLSLQEVPPEVAEKLAMPAKNIALHLQNATVPAALDELQKQSGIKIGYRRNDEVMLDKKLSLDLETPYLATAFGAVMDAAGIQARLEPSGNDGAYGVDFLRYYGDKSVPLLSGAGPFQVRLQKVASSLSREVVVSADKKSARSQNLSYYVILRGKTDPMAVITGSPLIILKRVDDDQGRSLLDTDRDQWIRYEFDDDWPSVSPQLIKTPAPDAKTLSRIEGVVVYVVPSVRQKWQIADITNQKDATHEFQSGGRTVRVAVKNASRENDVLNINIEITTSPPNNGGGEYPLFSAGRIIRAFTLQDANGNIFQQNSYNGNYSRQAPTIQGQFTLNAPRDRNGEKTAPPEIVEPIKLVFDAPTEWVQTQVPFSFSDVPLP